MRSQQRLSLLCKAHSVRWQKAEKIPVRRVTASQLVCYRRQSFATANANVSASSPDLNSIRLALVDLKVTQPVPSGGSVQDLSARISTLASIWRQLRACCDSVAASVPAEGSDHATLQVSHAKLHGAFLLFYDALYSTAAALYGPALLSEASGASRALYMANAGQSAFPVSSQEHLHAVTLQSLVKEAPMVGVCYACPPDARSHARLVRVAGLRSVSAAQRCLNLYALGGSTLSQEAVLSFLRACVRHGNALAALPALFLMEERGWDLRNPEHAALGRCAGVGIRRQLALLEKLGRGKQGSSTPESAASSSLVSAAEAAQVAASIRSHAVILGHLANIRLKRQVETGKKRMEGYRMTAQALAEMREALETVSAAKASKAGAGGDEEGQQADEDDGLDNARVGKEGNALGRTQASADAAQEKAEAEATLQAALMQALAEVRQAELDAEREDGQDDPLPGEEGSSSLGTGAADSGVGEEDMEEEGDTSLQEEDDNTPMDLADLRANRDELAAMLGFDPQRVSDEDLTDALAVALGTMPGGSTEPGDNMLESKSSDQGQLCSERAERSARLSAATVRAEQFASYQSRFKDAAAGLVHSACAQDAPDELLSASLQALEQLSVGFPLSGTSGRAGGGPEEVTGALSRLDWVDSSTPSASWPGASTEESRSTVLLPSAAAIAATAASSTTSSSLAQASPTPQPYKAAVQSLVQARAQVLLLFGRYLLGLGQGQGSYGSVPMPSDPRLHMAAGLPVEHRRALLAEVQGRLEAGLGGAVWGIHDLESVGPIGPAASPAAAASPHASPVSPASAKEEAFAVKGGQDSPEPAPPMPAAVRKQLVAALLGACLSEQPVPTRSHMRTV